MENRIKRKLVCTGWLLDISSSTTNARKKLLIDFRGRICSGKGGCKCGNCRVRQPQALRVTTFPIQITRQKTYVMSMDGEHQDVILGQRHLRSFFPHMTMLLQTILRQGNVRYQRAATSRNQVSKLDYRYHCDLSLRLQYSSTPISTAVLQRQHIYDPQ